MSDGLTIGDHWEIVKKMPATPFLVLLVGVDKGEGLGLKIRKEVQFQGIEGESCRAYGSLPVFF
jgi:hypothetical protein